MLGLFLLGIISRTIGNTAALLATAGGILTIIWMTLSPRAVGWFETLGFSETAIRWASLLESPFHKFLITVFGTATILLLGLLLGCIVKPSKTSSDRLPQPVSRKQDTGIQ